MNACLLALLLVAAPAAVSASAPAPTKAAAAPAAKPAAKPAATSTPTPLANAAAAAAATPANKGQAQPGPPVLVQGRDVVDPSVPSKYRAKIAEAQTQGALLQQEDVAVWIASNALVRSGLKPPTGATATGWLANPVNPQALLWKVVFTAKQGTRHFSFADIDVDLTAPPAKFRVDGHAAGRDLSPDEVALTKAVDAIDARSDWLRCAHAYNYSARFVTGGKGREIRVRAIPARNDAKQYLLGGFHEYTFPEKGGKSRHFEQTTTCLELPLPKNGLGFMVTSLNSDTPTLFHVFASLSYERPVYVKTNSRTWKVDAGKVTVVDKKSLKSVKIQDPPAK